MRSIVIILAQELVEACLLRELLWRWRMGRFGLQGAMHSLVAPILLQVTRLNSLVANAQLDPPDVQLGQSTNRRRGKWRAIVGTNRLGQTIVAKAVLEDRLHAQALD